MHPDSNLIKKNESKAGGVKMKKGNLSVSPFQHQPNNQKNYLSIFQFSYRIDLEVRFFLTRSNYFSNAIYNIFSKFKIIFD
jgi:hypothetical protein